MTPAISMTRMGFILALEEEGQAEGEQGDEAQVDVLQGGEGFMVPESRHEDIHAGGGDKGHHGRAQDVEHALKAGSCPCISSTF